MPPAPNGRRPEATPKAASVFARIGPWLAGAVVVAGLAGYWVHHAQVEATAEQRRRAGLLISELPAGVEEQWVQYATASVERVLSRQGQNYIVNRPAPAGRDDGMLIASIRRGYVLKCDVWMMSIVLDFAGGDATEVAVLDVWGGSGDRLAPPLGVDAQSIAAQNLMRRLCLAVAAKIDAIGAE
jgi:hypothetical protein